jgi:hypothetical protein
VGKVSEEIGFSLWGTGSRSKRRICRKYFDKQVRNFLDLKVS